ncbi:LssY C-terminal domain-containing protein, partial [Congregibacter sp.]|uniref:LssY C-terminal domain-containing protein n=1 Tax=Congregibacter sp. TaxID=2744308 RepID=UPI003F6B574A
LSVESISRLIGATLSSTAYPVAPVSDLFFLGRKQDLALQRGRASIAQRNHMRLWLAPFRYAGRQVWVGQVSRDIGIKLTPKSASLTTHIIDPEVDLAREYLLQTLLAGGFVEVMGFAKGSNAASRTNPAFNLVGDSYFSDGLRLVVQLSDVPTPYSEVRSFLWERAGAPVSEGQSAEADRNSQALDQEH